MRNRTHNVTAGQVMICSFVGMLVLICGTTGWLLWLIRSMPEWPEWKTSDLSEGW